MALELFPPLRFRFADPADVEKYGSDWTVYDEAKLTRVPTRDLIAIESELAEELGADYTLLHMVRRLHESTEPTDAKLAAMWVSRRMAGTTEPLKSFDPLVHTSEWEPVPADDADPPAADGPSSPNTEPTA